MRVCQEEIFGPVAPVLTVPDRGRAGGAGECHAVRAGRVRLHRADLGRATRVAEALEYGLVGLDDAAGYTHEVPFGGFKESGLGREGGREGLEEYLETKSVVVGLPPARWPAGTALAPPASRQREVEEVAVEIASVAPYSRPPSAASHSTSRARAISLADHASAGPPG